MKALKIFLFHVLRKYHIDPENFSGKLDFEIEISHGEISLLNHNVVSKSATRH